MKIPQKDEISFEDSAISYDGSSIENDSIEEFKNIENEFPLSCKSRSTFQRLNSTEEKLGSLIEIPREFHKRNSNFTISGNYSKKTIYNKENDIKMKNISSHNEGTWIESYPNNDKIKLIQKATEFLKAKFKRKSLLKKSKITFQKKHKFSSGWKDRDSQNNNFIHKLLNNLKTISMKKNGLINSRNTLGKFSTLILKDTHMNLHSLKENNYYYKTFKEMKGKNKFINDIQIIDGNKMDEKHRYSTTENLSYSTFNDLGSKKMTFLSNVMINSQKKFKSISEFKEFKSKVSKGEIFSDLSNFNKEQNKGKPLLKQFTDKNMENSFRKRISNSMKFLRTACPNIISKQSNIKIIDECSIPRKQFKNNSQINTHHKIFERNHKWANLKNFKIKLSKNKILNEELMKCTFSPKLSKKSAKII